MIEVIGLNKLFPLARHKPAAGADAREGKRGFEAVRDVSFHCARGEVLGLLGPNGAGKTTTLRMLSTAIAPTRGRIKIDAIDLVAQPMLARRSFGFLSGATGLYGRLTVRENLQYFGRAHGLQRLLIEQRIAELLKRFDIESYADRRADSLSAGMKQRAAIARTVMHAPDILILDEPTTGLDILGAQIVADFINDCRARNVAVVFSTHHLHEIEALCDRVCVIDRGRSVFEDSVARLREAGGGADLAAGYLAQLKH
jgi:sodium transport system ATP-binding protein